MFNKSLSLSLLYQSFLIILCVIISNEKAIGSDQNQELHKSRNGSPRQREEKDRSLLINVETLGDQRITLVPIGNLPKTFQIEPNSKDGNFYEYKLILNPKHSSHKEKEENSIYFLVNDDFKTDQPPQSQPIKELIKNYNFLISTNEKLQEQLIVLQKKLIKSETEKKDIISLHNDLFQQNRGLIKANLSKKGNT